MNISPGYIYMILAVIFFAVMNTSVKFLSHIPFVQVVFLRALASMIFCALMMWRQKVSFQGHDKKTLFYRGFFGTLAMSLYIKSLQDLPLASAVSILQMAPLFMLFVSGVLLRESARLLQWIFVILAFVGVLFVKGFETDVSAISIGIALVAAFLAAVSHSLIRKLKETDHALVIIFYFSLISVLFMLGPSLYLWKPLNRVDWIWVLILGLSTQAAQVFLTQAYHREKVVDVGVLNYLGIVIGVFIGIYIFDETYTWVNYVGMAIIVLSIYGETLIKKISALRSR